MKVEAVGPKLAISTKTDFVPGGLIEDDEDAGEAPGKREWSGRGLFGT